MGDAEIQAFARANRRSRIIKITLLGLLVASPLLWVIYKNVSTRERIAKREEAYQASIALTEADKDRMRARLPVVRAQLEEAARVFAAAVTPQALAALEDSGRVCPSQVSADSVGYTSFAPGKPITSRIGYDLAALDDIQTELASITTDQLDLERLEQLASPADYLFIVVDRTEPVMGFESFATGQVVGFAYLYSHRAKRVTCFCAFAATNSPAVDFKFQYHEGNILDESIKARAAGQAKLVEDLDRHIRREIVTRLHATL